MKHKEITIFMICNHNKKNTKQESACFKTYITTAHYSIVLLFFVLPSSPHTKNGYSNTQTPFHVSVCDAELVHNNNKRQHQLTQLLTAQTQPLMHPTPLSIPISISSSTISPTTSPNPTATF
jgi:hypothetical protein